MPAAENRADNIGGQERETEQPRRIGRNYALGFGNILEGQASIREKLRADGVGAEEKTDKAGIGSCRLRPIVDDDPQLLAGAFEASWDGQSCHLAIDLGLGLVNRLAFARFVQAAQDLVLIQRILQLIEVSVENP